MMVQKPTEAPLFPFWIEDRGLSFFFGFLVLITIFVPMVHLSRSGRIALDLIFALMLFSGAVATIRKINSDVSSHSAHRSGVNSGLDCRIQPIPWPPGLGYDAEDIRLGDLGRHDTEAHVSSGSD